MGGDHGYYYIHSFFLFFCSSSVYWIIFADSLFSLFMIVLVSYYLGANSIIPTPLGTLSISVFACTWSPCSLSLHGAFVSNPILVVMFCPSIELWGGVSSRRRVSSIVGLTLLLPRRLSTVATMRITGA
jgi:hypothetical protein